MTRAMFVSLTLLISVPVLAEADLDGRMAIRTIYATDDGPIDKTVFINFLDADIDATGLGPFGTRIVLDSTFMFDATQVAEHRFGATESMQRIRQLYVGQAAFGDRFHVNIGRRIIPETGNAWFDGVELLARLSEGWRLGVYGGLKPEPHSFYPSTEQQVAGSFATFRRDGLSSDLGYNVVLRDGFDRQFVFSRVHYRPFSKFYISTYLTADLLDDPDVTTLLTTVD